MDASLDTVVTFFQQRMNCPVSQPPQSGDEIGPRGQNVNGQKWATLSRSPVSGRKGRQVARIPVMDSSHSAFRPPPLGHTASTCPQQHENPRAVQTVYMGLRCPGG